MKLHYFEQGEHIVLIMQKQPPKGFYKKAVLKNFAIFTGKYLCWSLLLIKAFAAASNYGKVFREKFLY